MTFVKESKRELILSAAATVFMRDGLKAATMEAIAADAGVSKRTLYKYFQNKDLLFEDIVEELFSACIESTRMVFDEAVPVSEQLQQLAEQEAALLCHPRFIAFSRVVLGECIRSEDYARRLMEKHQALEHKCGFHQWLEAANRAGKLNVKNIRTASDQFFAIIKATVFWPQLLLKSPAPDQAAIRQSIDTAVTMFLAAYGTNA